MLKARQAAKVVKGLRGKAFDLRTHPCGTPFHPRWVVTGIDMVTGHAFMVRDYDEWQANPESAKHPVAQTAIRGFGF